jgi:hypothetical protein
MSKSKDVTIEQVPAEKLATALTKLWNELGENCANVIEQLNDNDAYRKDVSNFMQSRGITPPERQILQTLTAHARKYLELLMLPSPTIDLGTPYERTKTPYCHLHEGEGHESLVVVFSDEARNSSWMGDEDNYHRSEYYELPIKLITELLADIEPGGQRMCAVGYVNVFKEDSAFGYDCEEPHEYISHRKKEVSLFAELSEDQRRATLSIKIYNFRADTLDEQVCLSRTAKE